jgi:hypothetical protein
MSAVPGAAELDLVSGTRIPTLAGRETMRVTRSRSPNGRSRRQPSVVLWFGVRGDRLVSACSGFEIASAMTHVEPGNSHQLTHGLAIIRR